MQKIGYFSILSLIILGIILFFSKCDKIEAPYFIDNQRIVTDVEFPSLNPNTLVRKILIEEYSAQQCQNCPQQGHIPLQQLLDSYSEQLVAICIHAGSLARPDLIPPFDYDFRTEIGTNLYNQYVLAGGSGIPCAVINRTKYQGAFPLGNNNWLNAIQSIDNQLYAGIQILTKFQNNILVVHTKTTFFKKINNPIILSIFLIENNIISPQLDGSEIINNYIHNHILRTAINGLNGSYLTETETIEKDSAYFQSYQLDFSDHDWKRENCQVIVFISDKNTGEVLQVESVKID